MFLWLGHMYFPHRGPPGLRILGEICLALSNSKNLHARRPKGEHRQRPGMAGTFLFFIQRLWRCAFPLRGRALVNRTRQGAVSALTGFDP